MSTDVVYRSLKDEIDTAKRLVNTDTVQITIGEIASMYDRKELDIIPDFQRLFRWSIEKKSSFVESLLIGIPVPPAFAYENEDGTWELIDGLQRVSTILEFMGLLRDPDDQTKYLRSVLSRTKYLTDLYGVAWDSKEGDLANTHELDRSLKLFFRRSRIDFQVLKHPSDPKTKYDLFQRLNRGGAYANEQEVRSCAMVLANRSFTSSIRQLSESEKFTKLFKISKDQKLNQRNMDYAVRLIVHTFCDYTGESDVQEFLDKSIIDILTQHDEVKILSTFSWTIDLLYAALGSNALIPTSGAVEGVANRFSLRALEAIVVGVARNRHAIENLPKPQQFVEERITSFWAQPDTVDMSASGLRGTTRLQRTIPFGAKWFNPYA